MLYYLLLYYIITVFYSAIISIFSLYIFSYQGVGYIYNCRLASANNKNPL